MQSHSRVRIIRKGSEGFTEKAGFSPGLMCGSEPQLSRYGDNCQRLAYTDSGMIFTAMASSQHAPRIPCPEEKQISEPQDRFHVSAAEIDGPDVLHLAALDILTVTLSLCGFRQGSRHSGRNNRKQLKQKMADRAEWSARCKAGNGQGTQERRYKDGYHENRFYARHAVP